MAKLYVTEYQRLARDDDGAVIMAGEEPALAEYEIDFSSTSTQSPLFNENTRVIMVKNDGTKARIRFGESPTALDTDKPIQALETIFFGISRFRAASLRLAVKE